MKSCFFVSCLAIALAVRIGPPAAAADRPQDLNLQQAIPVDAFLAVYGKHNPERDFQREYYRQVWQTIQETRIVERTLKIITQRMSQDDLEQAQGVMNQLSEAVAPIDLEAVFNCEEIVYAQMLQFPTSHHLVALRLTEEGAMGMEQGVTNLLRQLEQLSDGRIGLEQSQQENASVTSLRLPPDVPLSPTIVRRNDLVLFSTSRDVALRSLRMLIDGTGPCKFDDPRVQQALSRLPEPEDALIFYDGKLQMEQLRALGPFIRQNAGGQDVERAVRLLDRILDEVSILDFEITVEYTEGNQNCSVSYGRLRPNVDDKVLTKVLGSGEPFDAWASWVPDKVVSYSLNTGVNLHPVYQWITEVLPEYFPEVKPGLQELEKRQAEWDIHVDRDFLQAFSGEFVSVTLPAATPTMLGGQDSVLALRCHQPERIHELLHRLFDHLSQHPLAKSQQLQLKPVEALEGFEEISALPLAIFGARPVIGFHQGWMFVGSNRPAVLQVLDARAGRCTTIDQTEAFTRFGLEVTGPVDGITYTDVAAQTRSAAQFLQQVGPVAQAVVGLLGIRANAEQMQVVQEVLGLLPSIGEVISKFDFLQAKLTVVQSAEDPSSYLKRTVVIVRPPSTE